MTLVEKDLAFQVVEQSLAASTQVEPLIEEKLTLAITIALLEISRSASHLQHWQIASILRGDTRGPAQSLRGETGSSENIAQSNAYLLHALLQDDSYKTAFHPGQLILPVCLAVAQSLNSSGGNFRAAVRISYEVACRLADIFLPEVASRGWRVTPLLAPMVSAIATISLLAPADPIKLAKSINLAAAGIGGSMHTTRGGNQWQTQSALQIPSGMFAAKLVDADLGGNGGGLDSQFGALDQFLGRRSYSLSTNTSLLPEVTFKLYPAPMFAQAVLQACDKITISEDFHISEVNVYLSEFAHSYGGKNREESAIASLENLVFKKLKSVIKDRSLSIDGSNWNSIKVRPDKQLTDHEARVELGNLKGEKIVFEASSAPSRLEPEEIIARYSDFPADLVKNLITTVDALASGENLVNLQRCWEEVDQGAREQKLCKNNEKVRSQSE